MYWSEVGSHSRLMEASMDGSWRHVLLAQGLGWPTALALDLPTQRIFWLDEKLGSVGSAHLDGSSVKVWWGTGDGILMGTKVGTDSLSDRS